jgi:hypothetical protein
MISNQSVTYIFDDGNDRGFRNVGQQKLDAGEIPKRIYSKFRIVMKKAAFNKERDDFASKMGLKLRKKLVKCYIWNVAFYGA